MAKKIVTRLNELLDKNGVFYFTTGNTDMVSNLKEWDYVRPLGHLSYFNYSSMDKLLRDSGFKVKKRESLKSNKVKKIAVLFLSHVLKVRARELPIGIKK